MALPDQKLVVPRHYRHIGLRQAGGAIKNKNQEDEKREKIFESIAIPHASPLLLQCFFAEWRDIVFMCYA